MATIISRKQDILKRLETEGKVVICNSPEDHERRRKMNEHIKKVRREFLIKSHNSEISASKLFLTC